MNFLWNKHTRPYMLQMVQHIPIHKGRVMCICWGGNEYNCNPRAIAEALRVHNEFEVCFAFAQPEKHNQEITTGIHAVEIGSLKYFWALATSQFVISNTRFAGGIFWPFPKREGQIYIQTMHGGHGIKKVEWDANLPSSYIEIAEKDRQTTDLMLSNSRFWTHVYRTSFRYHGEILEQGLPRNDVFQTSKNTNDSSESKHYLIYTPTYRSNGRKEMYGFDIDKVISAFETRFGGEWYIRISSHPNMRSYYQEIYNFSHPRMIDVGGEDLQPLLLTSDALITDYSSAEMDFSLTRRPVFQLCKDRKDYDRGFYINPEELPFPYAETDAELVQNILNFNQIKYLADLEKFNTKVIGLNETGHAAEAVVKWMQAKL